MVKTYWTKNNFVGECWLSNDEANFKRDGKTSRCVDNQFNKCEIDQGSRCRAPLCAGEWKANKVYELKQGEISETPR